MSRIGNNPLLLGFEDIERMLERIAKAGGDSYPPYNIERIRTSNGRGDVIRIVLAVAGFTKDQLEVAVEDSELKIRGVQPAQEQTRDFLHRGIAARQFQRSFVLADGLIVQSAELDSGLLAIDLVRPEAARGVKRIEINDRS
jgi:HSP20 family molecular chaperone IbpA